MHSAILLLGLLVSHSGEDLLEPPPDISYKTGEAFAAALESNLSAVWRNESLRHVLRRISDLEQVAVVLDRRIDPGQPVDVEVTDRSLREVLGEVAEAAGAGLSIVGSTAYLGPPEVTAKLRTLVELRDMEISQKSLAVPTGRRIELLGGQVFTWNNLDEPRAIVERIAADRHLEVTGLDRVPHDLWAGAALAGCDAAQALSLVLIQYDLTFHWTPAGRGIEIVPAPQAATIERSYDPPRITAAVAAENWAAAVPGIEARAEGGRVVVRGTVEQHEAIARLIRPEPERPRMERPTSEAPLSRRRFTLQRRGSAEAVIAALRRGGVEVVYDEERLAAAKVDLKQLVDLDLENATAQEFFTAFCEPLGLTFTIEGRTVTLEPR